MFKGFFFFFFGGLPETENVKKRCKKTFQKRCPSSQGFFKVLFSFVPGPGQGPARARPAWHRPGLGRAGPRGATHKHPTRDPTIQRKSRHMIQNSRQKYMHSSTRRFQCMGQLLEGASAKDSERKTKQTNKQNVVNTFKNKCWRNMLKRRR